MTMGERIHFGEGKLLIYYKPRKIAYKHYDQRSTYNGIEALRPLETRLPPLDTMFTAAVGLLLIVSTDAVITAADAAVPGRDSARTSSAAARPLSRMEPTRAVCLARCRDRSCFAAIPLA